MCGVAGIINKDFSKINYENLKKMTNIISHRGPDGEGFFMEKKKFMMSYILVEKKQKELSTLNF